METSRKLPPCSWSEKRKKNKEKEIAEEVEKASFIQRMRRRCNIVMHAY